MNRLPWLAVGLTALILLGFLLWYTPERRAALQEAPRGEPAAVQGVLPGPAPRTAALREPPSAAPTAAPNSPAALVDAAPPDPKGPFEVDLGRHTVHLREVGTEQRVMRFNLRLMVDNKAAEREARLRREELIRMVFFLGSHRVAEGALGQEGRDRFANDLLDRFRNVVRSGTVEQVTLVDYEVVPAASLKQ